MERICKRYGELTPDELYDILMARCAVFVVEQECPYQDVDGLDRESLHVTLREDGALCAYLRLFPIAGEPGTVQMGRVLTLRRGEGLGAELLREGIRAAAGILGAKEIRIEAQTYAAAFYAREGFEICSEEFSEDGIPHVRMRLRLEKGENR